MKENNYKPTSNSEIDVVRVSNFRKINKFITLPRLVYGTDPAWIPALYLERLLHISRMNPYFQHAEWQGWLAIRNGEVVGRISAQIDRLHQAQYGADNGHFGFLDAIDDPGVFAALLGTAERWLLERGIRRVTGPMSFSINQECGLLVDGFEHPPVVMMPHSTPWHATHLEEFGYRKARDLFAYWVRVDFTTPRVMQSLLKRYGGSVRMRTLKRKEIAGELELLRDIFNDAWSENWGFVPFTREEFSDLGKSLRLIVPDEFIQIAELDGEPVAFIAGLPNINELVRQIDGKLLPSGWLKLIQGIRKGKVDTGRVPLMGVRKKYQNRPVGMALAFLTIDALRRELQSRGIREVEMSWILEDNSGMRSILDSIGSELYKTYRLYEKELSLPDDGIPIG